MTATVESGPLANVLTPEIEKFCERIGIMEYLPRMVEGVHEIFPELTAISLSQDWNPEIEGDEWLTMSIEWPGSREEYKEKYLEFTRLKIATLPASENAKFLLVVC